MNNTFPKRLKEARQRKNYTQKELEHLSGCPQSGISAAENGKSLPNLADAVALAKALGVSLDWLCGIDTKDETMTAFQWLCFLDQLFDNPPEIYKDIYNSELDGHQGRIFNSICLTATPSADDDEAFSIKFAGEGMKRFIRSYMAIKEILTLDKNTYEKLKQTLFMEFQGAFTPGHVDEEPIF